MIEKRIIILSDIHGNLSAYKKALLIAEEVGFDQLINLGDLFTYGCDITEVLELTSEMIHKHRMKLIKGNHDQLYFDLINKDYSYYNRLPNWIKESVDWTMNSNALNNFYEYYDWLNYFKVKKFFFAHANPFGYGDWNYLNNKDKCIESALALSNMNCKFGIFGHTHRKNINSVSKSLTYESLMSRKFFSNDLIKDKLSININVDSIGQPRNKNKKSSISILDIKKSGVEIEFKNFLYNVDTHIKKIKDSSLSDLTKRKLISFF